MPEQELGEVVPAEDRRPAAWRWVVALLGLFAGGSAIALVIIGLLLGALVLLFLFLTSGGLWACLLSGECGGG
jgi:hypothetical protein